MPQTVEVRFKGTRRDFFLWPDDQEPLRLREPVVVELERGQDLGRVHTVGELADKKCGGGCTACAIGEGLQEAATGGRAVETEEGSAEPEGEEAAGGDETDQAGEFREGEAPRSADESSAVPPAPETPPVPPDDTRPTLRPVLRRATQEDVRVANDLRRSEDNVRRQVLDKVRQHRLDMKVSDAEWQWDKAKLSIYFTAEKRVDFRALVRDLAGIFRTRIELRQIGVRDEAARLTGVGRCGREYCCSSWLKDLSPVSLALAKDQHLSLNPAQISGGCGRLLCCLKYEHEFYVASRRRFPREGKALETALGREKVVAVDIFRERVFLRSEEHGPRIIPLVQLREEMEAVAANPVAPPAEAPAPPQTRRPAREGPPPRREPERRSPSPERPPRPERRSERSGPDPSEARVAPPTPPGPPVPPSGTPAGQPGEGGAKRSRRRRRGRRGRGGQGGAGGPGRPGTPPPSEGPA